MSDNSFNNMNENRCGNNGYPYQNQNGCMGNNNAYYQQPGAGYPPAGNVQSGTGFPQTANPRSTYPSPTQPSYGQAPYAPQAYGVQTQMTPPKKKKTGLIVGLVIGVILLSLAGFFAYSFFFANGLESTIWTTEIDGETYCFDFRSDGTYTIYAGSAEIYGTYTKSESAEGNTLTLDRAIGDFMGYPCTYEIIGYRILGNQQLLCSYEDGDDFTLTQGKKVVFKLEPSPDFVPDEELVGTWVYSVNGRDYLKVTFDDKGYMSIESIENGLVFNGTYTVDDGDINFTSHIGKDTTDPSYYSIEDGVLHYMGYTFEREDSAE